MSKKFCKKRRGRHMCRSASRNKRPTRAGGVSAAIFAKRTDTPRRRILTRGQPPADTRLGQTASGGKDAAALCGERFGETAEFPRKYAAFA